MNTNRVSTNTAKAGTRWDLGLLAASAVTLTIMNPAVSNADDPPWCDSIPGNHIQCLLATGGNFSYCNGMACAEAINGSCGDVLASWCC